MKNLDPRSFTLVELLVVVAIIFILAAFLFPAFTQIRKSMKITKAKADVHQLETALIAFRAEYGRWPDSPPDEYIFDAYPDGTTDLDGPAWRDLSTMLNGNRHPYTGVPAAPGSWASNWNPRAIQFMEFDKKSVNTYGQFLDPWGMWYTIWWDNGQKGVPSLTIDARCNGDGVTPAPSDGFVGTASWLAPPVPKPVVVHSWGPNRQDGYMSPDTDDICNWHEDVVYDDQ